MLKDHRGRLALVLALTLAGIALGPVAWHDPKLAAGAGITISFVNSAPSFAETTTAVIGVKLSGTSMSDITVDYTTQDGTGKSPTDYAATSGTLTFTKGTTGQNFLIALVNTTIRDYDRTVIIKLSNPSGATISGDTATLTILDDERIARFSAASYDVTEPLSGSVAKTITVELDEKPLAGMSMAVGFATSNGSATASTMSVKGDYEPTSGGLTFTTETSKTFDVTVNADTTVEGTETVILTLKVASGSVVLGSPSTATLNIQDASAPPPLPVPIPVAVKGTDGTFTPDPAPINTWVDTTLSAQALRPVPPTAYTLGAPNWSWSPASAQYSEISYAGPWNDGSATGYSYTIMSASSNPFDGIYDYSAVKISASFPIPGCWQLGFKAHVSYADSGGDAYEGEAQANCQGEEFEVTIKRQKRDDIKNIDQIGWYPVTDKNRDVLPGEFMNLYASALPLSTEVKLTYDWKLPGTYFKSYDMKPDKSTFEDGTKVDLKSKFAQFYWASTGDNSVVKCIVTAGMSKEGTATFNIKKPTINPAFAAAQGAVAYHPKIPDKQFGLYPTEKMIEGMEFSATVNVPAPFKAGEWLFIQTIKPSVFLTDPLGGKFREKRNGVICLDGTIPYKNSFKSPPPPSKDTLTAAPFSTGSEGLAYDTPQAGLTGTTVKYVEKHTLRMYIMFKPAGLSEAEGDPPWHQQSAWVPLQYIEWWWKGKATFANGQWQPLEGADQGKAAAQDTIDHPIWSQNITPPDYEPDQ